ncbi:MAG: hypothetical protein ABL930_02895 [Pseudobdellovibrio sp.]
MTSTPAIALYLGESYATIGFFDIPKKNSRALLFEKSIFLPQVSLKNLLTQVKVKYLEYFPEQSEANIYVVTKYLDRLKQFRLGGSISQVILKGFENSYTLNDSKCLSLAATQLIISLDKNQFDEAQLTLELERIKKINPDLNKVVISVPEEHITSAELELLHNFFTTAGLKIFTCTTAHDQSQLRKTLLNAGSEGTKEEIVSELKEAFGENSTVSFYAKNGFQTQFENCELFNSTNNFLAQFIKNNKIEHGAYFDVESLKFIQQQKGQSWQSPWGAIPIEHSNYFDLFVHPFSEVKLNHLSILQVENGPLQLEPGPVIAGRAIKPLMLDLFYQELAENELCKNLFSQINQENLKQKISNLFSVLEKGQKNPALGTKINDLKTNIIDSLYNEILFYNETDTPVVFGPLADVFVIKKEAKRLEFSWPKEILKIAESGSSL